MAVTSEDILCLAQRQLEIEGCEAGYRNLVSRAYYAVYHKALSFHEGLPSKGRDPDRKTGSHAELRIKLSRPTVSDKDLAYKSRRLGRLCRDMHVKRCKADYELDGMFNVVDAEQALYQAQDLFNLVDGK